MSLINSRLESFVVTQILADLGKAYCELTPTFLPSSFRSFHPFTLAHLRLPTCVSVRYEGHQNSILEVFLGNLVFEASRGLAAERLGNPIILPKILTASLQDYFEAGPEY